MKKWLLVSYLIMLFTVICTGCTGLNNQINRIGKDSYYVQVTKEGTKEDTGGSKMEIYRYELPAYDEKGNEKTIKFTSDKQLKKDAFLRLYVKREKEVTAWEEVSIEDVPSKAKEKMTKK
ncbi:YxeA family protein [Bacillus cereus]|uniref:YxeA family protein n=1 Tax=Bacillus cereus TaxID=1396 RepID=UPI001D156C12|nr:YxeA family protein [Bacillus cereus]MCC3688780.1 YxeA family protein [Bacillus cereus]